MDGCTLSAAELSERLTWIQAELLPHVRRWELEDAAGVKEKLEQWIQLERRCCSGLVLSLSRRGDRWVLEMRVA